MKCTCGTEMVWKKSYGNNWDEPREDYYICPKCGKSCWVDYCSVSWDKEVLPTEKELKEIIKKLESNGEVDISMYTDHEDIKYDILSEYGIITKVSNDSLIFIGYKNIEDNLNF